MKVKKIREIDILSSDSLASHDIYLLVNKINEVIEEINKIKEAKK